MTVHKCTLLDIEKSRSINFRSAFLLSILHYFLLDEYLLLKSKRIAETANTIIPNNAFSDMLPMNTPRTIEKIKLLINEFIMRSFETLLLLIFNHSFDMTTFLCSILHQKRNSNKLLSQLVKQIKE